MHPILTPQAHSYIGQLSTTTKDFTLLCKRTRFNAVKFLANAHGDCICGLCQALNVSRSGYYKWLKTWYHRTNRHRAILDAIQHYQSLLDYAAGYRKVALYLRNILGFRIGKMKVYRLMKKYGLLSRSLRSKKEVLFNRAMKPYANRLAGNFEADMPNQKWCIDMTKIRTEVKSEPVYLCAIIDLYDRSIVAYRTRTNLTMPLITGTIRDAITQLPSREHTTIILHSDQGNQFRNGGYKHLAKELNIRPSMSAPGRPTDNAPIESFYSCLKTEWIRRMTFQNVAEAIEAVDRYIYLYNHLRIHSKFGYPPAQVRSWMMG